MEGGCIEMKKEYMTPEAEMMKFEEVEAVMTGSTLIPEIGVVPDPGLGWD